MCWVSIIERWWLVICSDVATLIMKPLLSSAGLTKSLFRMCCSFIIAYLTTS